MILVCDLALTTPSILENEYTFLSSVKNWKVVGRSLSLQMFKRRLVLLPNCTSPKCIEVAESLTSKPSA
jgi:hypothetical protein